MEGGMAAFRRIDPIQMQWPWRELGGVQGRMGAGVKGGDADSFCQLQGYPRRTQRGTKESGDGDPREMTANLDRTPPPARTGNRADRVFNPFAARHHWFNLQCLNPIRKRSWQHFGALTQFRCNCPGENWVGCKAGMGAGCEGGRCGFLLPASRISTKDRKGHEGKRRRRSQGDDRKSGPGTAAGAGCEGGRCGFLLPALRISTKDTKGHEGRRRRRSQGDDRKFGPCSAAGAGCEGGRCGFLLPASRISTKDRKGHEGKRRRRPQGDDRKSGPYTAAGAEHGPNLRSSPWDRRLRLPSCPFVSFVDILKAGKRKPHRPPSHPAPAAVPGPDLRSSPWDRRLRFPSCPFLSFVDILEAGKRKPHRPPSHPAPIPALHPTQFSPGQLHLNWVKAPKCCHDLFRIGFRHCKLNQ